MRPSWGMAPSPEPLASGFLFWQDGRRNSSPRGERMLSNLKVALAARRLRQPELAAIGTYACLGDGGVIAWLRYFAGVGVATGLPTDLLYSATSEGEQINSSGSKSSGRRCSTNLLSASHGSVYIFGSLMVTVSSSVS